jgi:hypothetical protein
MPLALRTCPEGCRKSKVSFDSRDGLEGLAYTPATGPAAKQQYRCHNMLSTQPTAVCTLSLVGNILNLLDHIVTGLLP